MSNQTTLHRWALAGAVAAMLAASAPSAFAQAPDTPAPPSTTPTATPPGSTTTTPDSSNTTPPATTTPDSSGTGASGSAPSAPMSPGMSGSGSMSSGSMSSGSMSSGSMSPGDLPTDYKILNNRYFDSTNLEQARARGLSDSEIASIVRVVKLTGLPFDQVSGMVERGETFPAIATEYNLKLSDVYNVDKEKQQISDYDALNKYATSLGKDSSPTAMPVSDTSSPAPTPAPAATPAPTPASASTSSATPTLDIVDTATAAKNLTVLVKALQIAGLVETLKGAGPFTVFAPTDRAFAKLPAGALDALEADPAKLKQVLTYHVIPANIMASDALAVANSATPTSPPTVEGATLQITKGKKGRLKVNNANVIKADIQASNGTIHIIDTVLMPPTDTTTSTAPTDTTTPPAAPTDAAPPTGATPPAAPGGTDATPPASPTPGATPTAPGTTPTPGQ